MEVALVSAALVGVGLAWRRNVGEEPEGAAQAGAGAARAATQRVPRIHASNDRPSESSHARADYREPAARAPAPPRESVSGRRDHSLFLNAPTQYERQMERIYRPPAGSKKEVKQDVDFTRKMDNVHVRSMTGYRDEFFGTLEKPVRMNNVNPVATTSGTASQLTGPGLNAGTAMTGTDGLHYGMVRMRPNITHSTFREMKGAVVPGKQSIDKRPAEVTLAQHAASGYTIGATGFEAASEATERMKFHAISEEYLTSAQGRAVVTGVPGAGGQRVEPTKSHTNRGLEAIAVADGSGRGVAGLQAADDRSGYVSPHVQTNRGRDDGPSQGRQPGGPAMGPSAPGRSQFYLPNEERNTTEEARGRIGFTNLHNPGQPMGTLNNNQPAQTTQRQSTPGFDFGVAAGAGVAWGGGTEGEGRGGQATTVTGRTQNEYRPGIAAGATVGGQHNQLTSYASGGLADATQRDVLATPEHTGPLKAVGVNAPMSYSDILANEGYSNRDVPQLGFVPPAQHSTHNYSIGADARDRPAPPNAAREGGAANQANINYYVRQNTNNQNPNRTERHNQRLDPQILDALTRNELALAA